jgi:hypothetical protein
MVTPHHVAVDHGVADRDPDPLPGLLGQAPDSPRQHEQIPLGAGHPRLGQLADDPVDHLLRDLRGLGRLLCRLPHGEERGGAGRHHGHRRGEQEQSRPEAGQLHAGSANL